MKEGESEGGGGISRSKDMDRVKDERTHEKTEGRTYGRTKGWKDVKKSGRTNKGMEETTDGW